MAHINFELLQRAKENICETVFQQVKYGKQSDFFNPDALACGQFLKVPDKEQHGYHGTTAAIRILAGNPEKYNDELRKLLKYFDKIKEDDLKKKDETNIIKNAELLYALSFVKAGTANTDELKNSIYEKINIAKNNDGGWAFFTDYKDDSDIFSTSLVYFAFKNQNYNNLNSTLNFLKGKLKEYKNNKIPDPVTFSKLCFLTYALTELKLYDNNNELKELLEKVVKKLWKSEYCIMTSEYEQNVEYPGKEKHFYVRIPWQLYLISSTISLIPRYFAKKVVIERINSIITSINDNDGFVYKQSGKNISTRTYSIVYEFLCNIKEKFKKNWKYNIYLFIDSIRIFIGNNIFKNIISFLGVLIIVVLIFKWLGNDQIDFNSIAPSIIASLLILSIKFGKSK